MNSKTIQARNRLMKRSGGAAGSPSVPAVGSGFSKDLSSAGWVHQCAPAGAHTTNAELVKLSREGFEDNPGLGIW